VRWKNDNNILTLTFPDLIHSRNEGINEGIKLNIEGVNEGIETSSQFDAQGYSTTLARYAGKGFAKISV
jgi:hypothetical protein